MDLTQMSEIELKALAFDQIEIRDQAQSNLSIILSEIEKRRKKNVEK